MLYATSFFKTKPLISNIITVLSDTAKCEFCNYVGIRESFFSKSKRFCKMECAKRYSSASNIKQKSKGDKNGTPKKKHRTSDRHHKVSLKLDLLSNIVTVLSDTAKCEFCCYIGVREHFFSKSKRFCKMECAKRYSASNIKKKSKGEKIGTPKKKHRTSERHAHNTNALASVSATTSSSANTAATASSVQEAVQDGQEVRLVQYIPIPNTTIILVTQGGRDSFMKATEILIRNLEKKPIWVWHKLFLTP